MTTNEIDNIFTYHPPTPDQITAYRDIRTIAREFGHMINQLCPESREKRLALTNLQQTVMWANASIALEETIQS